MTQTTPVLKQSADGMASLEQKLNSEPDVKQLRILSTTAGGDDAQHAVFLSLNDSANAAEPKVIIKRLRMSWRKHVESDAETIAVPKKWLLLPELPLNSSGSIDDKALLESIGVAASTNEAGGDTVNIIRAVVADVLRKPITNISPSSSFLRQGGDSITAIEVMARCMAKGITIRVPDIMRLESLTELAASATDREDEDGDNAERQERIVSQMATAMSRTLAYWGITDSDLKAHGRTKHEFKISGSQARQVLQNSAKRQRVSPLDYTVMAVFIAFQMTFTGRGRLDVWASLSGSSHSELIAIEAPRLKSHDHVQALRLMKDAFAKAAVPASTCSTELSFNVRDQRDVKTASNGLIANGHHQESGANGEKNSGDDAHVEDARNPRSIFKVLVDIQTDDLIQVVIDNPESLSVTQDIQSWMRLSEEVCVNGISNTASSTQLYSLSDFPLIQLSYPELDRLLSTLRTYGFSEIESIYPCSAVQDGIMLSQMRSKDYYQIVCTFEAALNKEQGSLDLSRLEDAWRRVVACHPALRTVFISSERNGVMFDQVVIKSFDPEIKHLGTFGDKESAMKELKEAKAATFVPQRPAHRFTTTLTADGRTFCMWELSHAIVDGVSTAVLLRDLDLAYRDCLPDREGPGFGDFIAESRKQPTEPALKYWTEELEGASPCQFPKLLDGRASERRELKTVHVELGDLDFKSFCQKQGITISVLLHAAWGIILGAYSQSDDVLFGFVSSGRDFPMGGVGDMVGALVNQLICRVKLGESSVVDLLQNIQNGMNRSFDHQHCSLATIQHELGAKTRLFNTLLSILTVDSNIGKDVTFTPETYYASTEVSTDLDMLIDFH